MSETNNLPTRVYFARSGSTPTGSSLTTLRRYAEWLARSRARRVYVVGHANLRGREDRTSRSLADERARAVVDLLVWLGARRDQVHRISTARLHRIRPESTRGTRAAHRCVELIVPLKGSLAARRARPPLRRAPARLAVAA